MGKRLYIYMCKVASSVLSDSLGKSTLISSLLLLLVRRLFSAIELSCSNAALYEGGGVL